MKSSSLGNTANNYIGKSQYPDPYLNGLIDEFRIYTVPLSASEIAATEALGPNQLLSTNSPTIGVTTTPTNLTLSWPLASADFTVQSSPNLASDYWITIALPKPQIVAGQWQVTLPLSGNASSTFYRLSKQAGI
jgi:Concanavalin A-like lectin/glucanases superfamily